MLNIESDYEYNNYLSKNSSEISKLYYEMLIGVTRFFRDREAFKFIQNNILPQLIDLKADGDECRIWVPGCASG